MLVKQNLFVSVFVHKCLMMFNDVEYTTIKMFVTQMSNYLFVISFQQEYLAFNQCFITASFPGYSHEEYPGTGARFLGRILKLF